MKEGSDLTLKPLKQFDTIGEAYDLNLAVAKGVAVEKGGTRA